MDFLHTLTCTIILPSVTQTLNVELKPHTNLMQFLFSFGSFSMPSLSQTLFVTIWQLKTVSTVVQNIETMSWKNMFHELCSSTPMLCSLEHAKFTLPGILLLFCFALFPVMFISSDLYSSLDLHLTSLKSICTQMYTVWIEIQLLTLFFLNFWSFVLNSW